MTTNHNPGANTLPVLNELIRKAGAAYQAYLAGGKTFVYAKRLWDVNLAIRELVLSGTGHFSADLQADAIALLPHIDAWMEKWLALKQELNPVDETVFVFENELRFNREAAARLAAAEH